MKINDIFCQECEIVYVDDNDNVLTESAIRQFKKVGNVIKRKYRCLAGKKKGKLVSHPGDCGTRKDPKKIRQGRKVMRSKKGVINRKSQISKKRSISKLITRLNKKLSENQL